MGERKRILARFRQTMAGYDIILARGAGADTVDGGVDVDDCRTDLGDTVTNCP